VVAAVPQFAPEKSLEDTCDRLLRELRHGGNHDDVALLVARVRD
jgi:hypothetical protein